MMTGVIFCLISMSFIAINCHDSPYLSCNHPYLSLKGYTPSSMRTLPFSESFFHNSSTSSLVLHAMLNDTEGLNLKRGPALIAMNSCPASSNETMSTEPDGVL